MAYPAISAIYKDSVRSEIYAEYKEDIHTADEDALNAVKSAAKQYNQDLFTGKISLLTPAENGYYEQMLASKSKVMCYISIPKINVSLPVYHGIGTDALNIGAGHMPQSSLPVGGANTHAVISAHTGMASSPMFTDLELLVPGDTFQITVLGETLTYMIQSEADIRTVLPQQIDYVQIKENEDLVTLVTCTPYGVNSHRLLVTGHRLEDPEASEADFFATVPAESSEPSVYRSEYVKSIWIGLGIGAALMAIGIPTLLLTLKRFDSKGERKHEDETQQ